MVAGVVRRGLVGEIALVVLLTGIVAVNCLGKVPSDTRIYTATQDRVYEVRSQDSSALSVRTMIRPDYAISALLAGGPSELFVAGHRGGTGIVQYFEVTPEKKPRHVTDVALGFQPMCLARLGNRLIVAGEAFGETTKSFLVVFDMAAEGTPPVLFEYTLKDMVPRAIGISGTHVFVAGCGGVQEFNFTQDGQLECTRSFGSGFGCCETLSILKDSLLVTRGLGGLQQLNAASGGIQLGTYSIGPAATGAVFSDTGILVAGCCEKNGVFRVSKENPEQASLIFPTRGYAAGLVVIENDLIFWEHSAIARNGYSVLHSLALDKVDSSANISRHCRVQGRILNVVSVSAQ